MFFFELGFQQLRTGVVIHRLLQQLLQRQDHALLTQAQGLILIQVAGQHCRAKRQKQQRHPATGASLE
ncbi:hypothetical protein D3C71_1771580 [compost metagenome]